MKAFEGSKNGSRRLIGKHLLWSQSEITVVWISLRAGEMEKSREGDLGYNSFNVFVSKSPDEG